LKLSANVSSQYPSAILMIAPLSVGDMEVELSGPLASRPYVEMTLRMMEQWGCRVEVEDGFRRFRIPGGQSYSALDYTVEPDASSASYFFAAAAVTGGSVTVPGIGQSSLQGDTAFLDVLEKMGCRVDRAPESTTIHGPAQLEGVDVDMNAISDTVMTLAAIAPFAKTPTSIRNVANIRYKETDRLTALNVELAKLGVEVEDRRDGLTIHPTTAIKPASIRTYDDHRIAMSFAITGLKSPGIQIENPECVTKTFPDFFARLQRLVNENP
jgi:3-phosphoshikimate 1-carboxyvinyltransferase